MNTDCSTTISVSCGWVVGLADLGGLSFPQFDNDDDSLNTSFH